MESTPLDRRLTPEEYLQFRVEAQLNYFERNSSRNKKAFYLAQTFAIIGAASVPVLLSFTDEVAELRYIASFLGGATAVVSSIITLRKQQEMWIKYRTTAEALQREKFLYLTRTGAYSAPPDTTPRQAQDHAYHTLVLRVEEVLSTENSGWGKFVGSGAAGGTDAPPPGTNT